MEKGGEALTKSQSNVLGGDKATLKACGISVNL